MVVAILFLYLHLWESHHPAAGFTTDYLKTKGIVIFQVWGFFIYTTAVAILLKKLKGNYLPKILTCPVAGALIELTFLVVPANYEGAFLYSILDKFQGAALGAIFYYYTHSKKLSAD